MISADILTEAAAIVGGDRNATHGNKTDSFVAIAAVWTAYLRACRQPGMDVRPADVANMMVLLKQQRAEWGTPVRDHFMDAAGYSAIAGEIMLGEPK